MRKGLLICLATVLFLAIGFITKKNMALAANEINSLSYLNTKINSVEAEYNDMIELANLIQANSTTYTGNLSTKDDLDYYKFVLDTPGSMTVNFKNEPNLNYYYWMLYLYKEDGEGNISLLVNEDLGVYNNNSLDKMRLPAGTYYIMVRSYKTSWDSYYSDKDYKVSIDYTPEDASSFEQEYNGDFNIANSIKTATTYTGNLSSKEDLDYYKFVLDKPGSITVNFKNEPNLNYYYWMLYLYHEDSEGTVTLLTDDEFGVKTSNSFNKMRLPAGTYYIMVRSYKTSWDSYYSNTDYRVSIDYTPEEAASYEQEYNGDFNIANSIKTGTTYTGNLSLKEDLDYYRFILDKPGSITVNFKNEPNLDYNYWMLYLYHEDSEGTRTLLTDYEFGIKANNTMNKMRLPEGTYYILVRYYKTSWDSYYSNTDYKVSIDYTPEKADSFEQEFNNSFKSANSLKLGNIYTANIDLKDDVDNYKFTLKKNTNIKIDFSNKPNLSSNYWSLFLYSEDYEGSIEELNNWDLGVSNSTVDIYGMLTAGTYYIKITRYSSYYSSNYSADDYKLTVKENIPGKVTSLKTNITTNNSITLSWKTAKDAESYQIYRSTSKNSGYKLIKTVYTTSYKDSKLAGKKTYYYKVRAVNSYTFKGSYSSILTTKTK